MLLHMFSIVFMLLLLRPVTTCYDAMLMPYALCVASIRHQLSDRPKRPLRLRGSSAHSRAQWSTVEHSGAQRSSIAIALESHWNRNCTWKLRQGPQHLLRPACLPRLGKRTSVYIHNTSAAFQHICFQECIFALVLEGSLNFGWEKHT